MASSSPDRVGTVNLADQQAIQEALSGQVFFSGIMPNETIGNPVCMITVPLQERDTVVGALLGVIDLVYLGQRYVAPVKIGQSGYAYLLDKNGLVIAYPDHTQLLETGYERLWFWSANTERTPGHHDVHLGRQT